MKRICEGWAIDTQSDEGHGFIGRYYWPNDFDDESPLSGYRTAVFATRKIARARLRKMKSYRYVAFPKARVVKVWVTVESA